MRMPRTPFIAVTFIFIFAAGPSFSADELCEQVKSFEQTPLTQLSDGELQRRWMDFSWEAAKNLKEDELQFGATLKCYGSDDAAKVLCQYALRNSPREHKSALPLGILRCQGFVSGRAVSTDRWVQELTWDTPNGLIEQFQIDQLVRKDHEPSMRLTIMPYPESPQARKPAPFFKALSAKLHVEDEDEE